MVRFDGYRRPPPLPSSGQQWQLLLWVMVLGAIAIVPQWLMSFQGVTLSDALGITGPGDSSIVPAPTSEAQRDFRPSQAPDGDAAGQAEPINERLAAIDFAAITDDAPFRNAEKTAWFEIFKILRDASPRDIWQARVSVVTFAELYRRPKDYRGRLVELRGHVAGVFPVKAPPNDLGIGQYYQIWLCPEQEHDPVVIYCLSLPQGFPVASRLNEPVAVRGVFFKRWAYQAQDGLRFAPVLLAASLTWQGTATSQSQPEGDMPNLFLATIIAVCFTGAILWYLLRVREATPSDPLSNRTFREKQSQKCLGSPLTKG